MNTAKQYKVKIFDEQFVLVSDEAENTLMQSVARVDMLMKEITEHSKNVDTKRAALLAAIRLAHMLIQAESEKELTKQMHEDMLLQIQRALF